MTLMEAAQKWQMSPNWVRQLIRSNRVKATLVTDVPVPYYSIPDGTPRPPSMQRAPFRKGSPKTVSPEALKRRKERAEKRAPKAKKPKVKAAKAK